MVHQHTHTNLYEGNVSSFKILEHSEKHQAQLMCKKWNKRKIFSSPSVSRGKLNTEKTYISMFILKRRRWEKEKLNKTERNVQLKWKSLILSKYDTFISHIIHLLFQTATTASLLMMWKCRLKWEKLKIRNMKIYTNLLSSFNPRDVNFLK